MKRIVLLIMMMAAMWQAEAQRPVGDTLPCPGMDSSYFLYIYDWCLMEDTTLKSSLYDRLLPYGVPNPASQCTYGSNVMEGNYKAGSQMFTNRPIKILGIAACAEREEAHHTTTPENASYRSITGGLYRYPEFYILNTLDTTLAGRATDSLILYKATSRGPELLAAGPWRIEYPHRYIVLPMRNEFPSRVICEYTGTPRVYDTIPKAALYEVIFDKPQVVTDSFIVIGTSNNNPQTEVRFSEHGESMLLWDRNRTLYWSLLSFAETPDTNNISWFKYKHYPWVKEGPRISWSARVQEPRWMRFARVIFPIIDPGFDTVLCDEVRDVRLASATDTTLTLMWNGGNDVQWEVEYGEMNGTTSSTVTTRVPMVTLTGLRARTNYVVHVRGMCEWDTEYGPWSEWLDVYTAEHHDEPLSTGNLGRFTQMMPNPASGQVTVLSSYRLSRVVVYDLGGRAVLEQEDDGLATTIDVGGLAKGVYVVAIHTPAGIATKRLVVE